MPLRINKMEDYEDKRPRILELEERIKKLESLREKEPQSSKDLDASIINLQQTYIQITGNHYFH